MKPGFSVWVFSLMAMLAWESALASAGSGGVIEGRLSLIWGDGPTDGYSALRVMVTDGDGNTRELRMSDEMLRSGVMRWNGRRVDVRLSAQASSATAAGTPLQVAAIRLLEDATASAAVTGSQPWVSLLCKYADVADEPHDLAYFQDMFGNAPGSLDHYWREVSYGAIDVAGSLAVDWVTLPGNQVDYAPTPGSGKSALLNKVFDDCTAAADALVDFSGGGTPFVGINLMLNADLDCCAWGGNRAATLDGVNRNWRVTWSPPFAYGDESILAHEMGHGFGLPHANNFDGDGNPYDSPWDVMSSATGYAVRDGVYGALGKHINASYKNRLGWIAPERRYEATPVSLASIELDHLALTNPTHYQMALIQISADYGYTVEARHRAGGYDAELPGDAVIIHEVDLNRTEPAWAGDADQPPADYGDNPGTMWEPGEAFVDEANGVAISVDYATETGFGVTIGRPGLASIFHDGYESNVSMLRAGAIISATGAR